MDNKFNRNLQLGYGFSVLMLALVGFFAFRTTHQLLDSNRAVAKSNLILQKLEKALSLMKDAETGQRGYLLTGREEFLEPYHGAPQQALQLINDTKTLTTGNAVQQANVEAIRQIVANRMPILKTLITKRQSGQSITAADLHASKSAMDALRQATGRAEIKEQLELKEKAERMERYSAWTPGLILGALILSIMISLWSYMQVVSDIGAKDRLRAELETKEQETAAFNEELTAANEEVTAANEELIVINEELTEAREELAIANESLEQRVADRTEALASSEEETQALNEELSAMNEELAATNEELTATNEELVAAKEETEKNEQLFRTIAQNIPGSLIIVMDKDHRFIAVEGDLMVKMGYDGRDYAGKHPTEVSPPERYEATKALYERMFAGEQFRTERKGTDGTDYQVDFVPLRNDRDELYAGLVIALDISDIKKAEERSAKLAAIVESSDDAIISKSLEGIITSWNRGAERMFGHTVEEMIGESILKLIPEDRQEEEPLIISRLKSGERVDHFETRRITREGKLIDVSLTISPIRDTNGNITGISKIARDISEKKQDEQRKNDFIAMASHELKTPLTTLTALIQVLDKKLQDNGDSFVPNALTKSKIQVRKMADMINGFLNVSRLESGKLHIDKHRFDLHELITESIEEVQLTAGNHALRFEVSGSCMVEADREKIASVISNLLSNAVKYSPKGRLVTVNCKLTDKEVLVSIHDEGMGIKPQDLGRLFDRYYRVATSHTQHISGFGIGLYLSAEIIRRHNGRIWAESESGVGSTFYFTLPLAEA